MDLMGRRTMLGGIGLLALSGCLATDEGDSGIEIEYSVSDPMSPDETPEEVIEHPNPEGFEWVAIEFEFLSGSIDVEDIMGLTQVEAGDTSHFTRAVEITSPDETLITDSEESYSMEQGTEGVAYYRIEEGTEPSGWVVEQLENEYGGLEATQA
ncbi:hypothetical protein [Saliphagus sp. LR7]|uniref:hypothetical protein n=1 Tax=Saliphagus sp. LR7 TaxID=2282654 RepID=UPI000DF7EA94|nr:hypothetical protein [Saliphagus sp. LR7]